MGIIKNMVSKRLLVVCSSKICYWIFWENF